MNAENGNHLIKVQKQPFLSQRGRPRKEIDSDTADAMS
jgi:hypothetical protein